MSRRPPPRTRRAEDAPGAMGLNRRSSPGEKALRLGRMFCQCRKNNKQCYGSFMTCPMSSGTINRCSFSSRMLPVRIQLASDLHLEFLARAFPGECTITPARGAELLVLAGDIAKGSAAIELFRTWPVPVVYLAGNHEAYGHVWSQVVERCNAEAQGTPVHFLERGAIELAGVRILGCTLWTDYSLYPTQTQAELMEYAGNRLNDHRLIRRSDGALFSTADALREHELSRAWLTDELARPYKGKTVVVTHHAPHLLSIHPRYEGDALNAAFASDLTGLMGGVNLWMHGHVHDSFDYVVGECRVVANPRGYARNALSANAIEDLSFENPNFQESLVVEV